MSTQSVQVAERIRLLSADWIMRSKVRIPLEEFSSCSMALQCTDPFIVTPSLIQYDLNNVEKRCKTTNHDLMSNHNIF